jgi:hypothetical protein
MYWSGIMMYFWKYSKRSIHQTQTIVSSKGVEVEVTEKIRTLTTEELVEKTKEASSASTPRPDP